VSAPVGFLPACVAALGSALALGMVVGDQPPAGRTTVVVSDLHMGIGRAADGAWHPFEDFRWPDALAAFLEAIDRQGGGTVDLVLNGDTFELLQSKDAACGGDDPEAGCSEPEALARLDRVLAAHDVELKALGRFAAAGTNRVVLVPGDHDAALLWPSAARRAVAAAGAPAGRVEVAAAGYWVSSDGRLYAEHGHQIEHGAHRFARWPAPFVERDGVARLTRPWGERVAQSIFNRLEERYPATDNFAVVGAGAKYALSADGVTSLGAAAAHTLRYSLFAIAWQQFRMELDDGEVQPPVWDLARARAQGADLLVSALPKDDPLAPLAADALARGALASALEDLSDEELETLCDYRAAVRRARRRFEPVVSQFVPRGPIVSECPRTPETRSPRFEYFWRARDRLFLRDVEAVAARLPGGQRPEVIVHGHTHLPDRAQSSANMISGGLLTIPMEGFSPVRGALTPVVINGGAWQRTITPVQFERRKADAGLSSAELLRSLQPEDLAACYSFVLVPPSAGTPEPAVRYFRRTGDGGWGIGASCGG
jgi:UDP-2,3-diacylglucosamine pyrophosphatase LpxH